MRYHACPHRVEFDIPHQRQQIRLAIHDRRPVAALSKGAAMPVGSIEVLHITPAHGPKHLADAVAELRRRQVTDMVSHPNMGS